MDFAVSFESKPAAVRMKLQRFWKHRILKEQLTLGEDHQDHQQSQVLLAFLSELEGNSVQLTVSYEQHKVFQKKGKARSSRFYTNFVWEVC